MKSLNMILLAILAVFIATGTTMLPATNEAIAYNLPFPIVGYLIAFASYSVGVAIVLWLFRDKKARSK
jgi:uncharacterized membrane protein